jgi:hypothetical protein
VAAEPELRHGFRVVDGDSMVELSEELESLMCWRKKQFLRKKQQEAVNARRGGDRGNFEQSPPCFCLYNIMCLIQRWNA